MSTPQPPFGPPQHPVQPPTVPPGVPVPTSGAPVSPTGDPSPQKPRPGRLLPVLALVFSIVGAVVVCLGFLAFLPEIGRVLGFSSFAGWAFLIAGLVLAIVALAKKAAAKGLSIAALIVSIAGGVIGVVAAIVVAIAGVISYTTTVIDEYGDLFPTEPEDEWSSPEGSADVDVQADCDALLAADPGATSDAGSIDQLLDRLAAGMTTDEVRIPLDDLADAYEDLQELDGPHDMAEATAELERAATELGAVCGIDLGQLQ